jgi:hypothetical protein
MKPELKQLMSSLLAIAPLQVRKSDLLIEQAAITNPLLKMVLKNRKIRSLQLI